MVFLAEKLINCLIESYKSDNYVWSGQRYILLTNLFSLWDEQVEAFISVGGQINNNVRTELSLERSSQFFFEFSGETRARERPASLDARGTHSTHETRAFHKLLGNFLATFTISSIFFPFEQLISPSSNLFPLEQLVAF